MDVGYVHQRVRLLLLLENGRRCVINLEECQESSSKVQGGVAWRRSYLLPCVQHLKHHCSDHQYALMFATAAEGDLDLLQIDLVLLVLDMIRLRRHLESFGS